MAFIINAHAGPDDFSTAKAIGTGIRPDMAIDAKRKTLHLVYVHNKKLYYKSGSPSGDFGNAEEILSSGDLWTPRISLDKSGVPHIVVGNGEKGTVIYYSNRIGGSWKPAIQALSKNNQKAGRTNNPHLAIDDEGNVFVSCKTNTDNHYKSAIGRIENASSTPTLAHWEKSHLGSVQLMIRNNELWHWGGERGLAYGFQQLDKQTLKPKGERFATALKFTEQARATVDHTGDLHGAGAKANANGTYQSLSRIKDKKKNIQYKTTMQHHSSGAMIVRDMKAANRVYVVHWSGAKGDKHGVLKGCNKDNQLRFMRVENDEKKNEEMSLTKRTYSHGSPFRMQPAAVAHPDGGMIVSWYECNNNNEMYMTRVGGDDSTHLKSSIASRMQSRNKTPLFKNNNIRVLSNSDYKTKVNGQLTIHPGGQ